MSYLCKKKERKKERKKEIILLTTHPLLVPRSRKGRAIPLSTL
jgi:hypothetical protein